MKGILILTLGMSVYYFFCGSIKVNGWEVDNPIVRYIISLICSFITSLIIILPILGIMYLIKQ